MGRSQVRKQLKIYNAASPNIWPTKTNIQLRPITCFIRTPPYNLSKYISGILKNIAYKSETDIKDFWQFYSIKNQTIPERYELISLLCNKFYLGHTQHFLKDILRSHWNVLENQRTESTSLKKHKVETGHKFHLAKSKILDIEQKYKLNIH